MSVGVGISKVLLQDIFVPLFTLLTLQVFSPLDLLASVREFYGFKLISLRHEQN